MGRKILRVLAWITFVEILGFVIGQVISRKLTKGDEMSDDFR